MDNMKAPDKLFVSSDPFGFMSAYYIENHPPYGEEYIRKDALIEWLDKNIKNLNVLSGEVFVAKVKDKLKQL